MKFVKVLLLQMAAAAAIFFFLLAFKDAGGMDAGGYDTVIRAFRYDMTARGEDEDIGKIKFVDALK